MLYVVKCGHGDYPGGQGEILHLQSTASAVTSSGVSWGFTDRHAELAYAEYFDDLGQLGELDWASIKVNYWADPAIKETKQAEFLVHEFFAWSQVEEIGVCSQSVADQVTQILAGAAHSPIVSVRP